MAQRVGLSLTNAERLLEVSRNQLNMRVTRNDLSLYLNTTPRTANRILNRLTELEAAVLWAQNRAIRPAHQHLSAGAAKAARPGTLNFIRCFVFFIALSGTFHSYL